MMSAQPQAMTLDGESQLSVAMRMIVLRLMVVGGAVYLAAPNCGQHAWVNCHFFNSHDVFIIALLGLALLALSFRMPGKLWTLSLERTGFLWVALLCGAVFVCGALGRDPVLGGFDLSRDEVMAVFDGEVFRAGRLFSSLPPNGGSCRRLCNRCSWRRSQVASMSSPLTCRSMRLCVRSSRFWSIRGFSTRFRRRAPSPWSMAWRAGCGRNPAPRRGLPRKF